MNNLTVSLIQDIVAAHFGVTVDEIMRRSAIRQITYARHIAMYLCRMLLPNYSTRRIGEEFGGMKDTGVTAAFYEMSEKRAAEPEVKQTIRELEQRIREAAKEPDVLAWAATSVGEIAAAMKRRREGGVDE